MDHIDFQLVLCSYLVQIHFECWMLTVRTIYKILFCKAWYLSFPSSCSVNVYMLWSYYMFHIKSFCSGFSVIFTDDFHRWGLSYCLRQSKSPKMRTFLIGGFSPCEHIHPHLIPPSLKALVKGLLIICSICLSSIPFPHSPGLGLRFFRC